MQTGNDMPRMRHIIRGTLPDGDGEAAAVVPRRKVLMSTSRLTEVRHPKLAGNTI